jgi:hypothetical protein
MIRRRKKLLCCGNSIVTTNPSTVSSKINSFPDAQEEIEKLKIQLKEEQIVK